MSADRSTNGTRPRLVLVDGHGLAFRAFYAVPPSLSTSSGELTNATFGFTSMLLDVLQQHEPDYVLVSFDIGTTFRHEQFQDYKAHRKPMPGELIHQVERMKEVLNALNIPIYVAEGFEADDVIGLSAGRLPNKISKPISSPVTATCSNSWTSTTLVLPGTQRFGDYRSFDREAVKERYGMAPSE